MVLSAGARVVGRLERGCEAGQRVEGAGALGGRVACGEPRARRSAKRVIQQNMNGGLEEALRYETIGLNFAGRTPHDVQESRLSFSEKRPPAFTGE